MPVDEFGCDEPLETSEKYDIALIHEAGLTAIREVHSILNSDEFKIRANHDGVKVFYRDNVHNNRMWAVEGIIPVTIAQVRKCFWDNMHRMPEYMPENIAEIEILARYGPLSVLDHSTSPHLAGGLISSRDFVITRKMREIDGWTYVCEQSAPNGEKICPVKKGVVRGVSYPSGLVMKPGEQEGTTYCIAIMNMDLKGFIPKSILNAFMGREMAKYLGMITKNSEKYVVAKE